MVRRNNWRDSHWFEYELCLDPDDTEHGYYFCWASDCKLIFDSREEAQAAYDQYVVDSARRTREAVKTVREYIVND